MISYKIYLVIEKKNISKYINNIFFTGTKDLQSIDIAVRMLFKPIPEKLP